MTTDKSEPSETERVREVEAIVAATGYPKPWTHGLSVSINVHAVATILASYRTLSQALVEAQTWGEDATCRAVVRAENAERRLLLAERERDEARKQRRGVVEAARLYFEKGEGTHERNLLIGLLGYEDGEADAPGVIVVEQAAYDTWATAHDALLARATAAETKLAEAEKRAEDAADELDALKNEIEESLPTYGEENCHGAMEPANAISTVAYAGRDLDRLTAALSAAERTAEEAEQGRASAETNLVALHEAAMRHAREDTPETLHALTRLMLDSGSIASRVIAEAEARGVQMVLDLLSDDVPAPQGRVDDPLLGRAIFAVAQFIKSQRSEADRLREAIEREAKDMDSTVRCLRGEVERGVTIRQSAESKLARAQVAESCASRLRSLLTRGPEEVGPSEPTQVERDVHALLRVHPLALSEALRDHPGLRDRLIAKLDAALGARGKEGEPAPPPKPRTTAGERARGR